MTSDPRPAPADPRRRRAVRALRTTAGIATACLLAWLILAYVLFYNPPLRTVGTADAVVVLAGAASERLPAGQRLVERGVADELVLSSTGLPGNSAADALCAADDAGTTCFRSDPLTTRGEARAIAALARDRGWDRIVVVTSTYHVTRAFTNISQCSEADITMAESTPDLDAVEWLGRFVEESAALAAALARPACARPV